MQYSASSKKLFFVSGAPKSGTTWLQKALDAHPEIMCKGEGMFCSILGHALSQAIQFYNNHLETVGKQIYDGAPYYDKISDADYTHFLRSFILRMLSQRPIPQGIQWVGDKTPSNAIHLDKLLTLFPAAKFIHIVRDVRDVAVSTRKHEERLGGNLTHYADLANRWIEYNSKPLEFAGRFPGMLHVVKYEDFLQDFDSVFKRVLLFLDIPASSEAVSLCREATSFEALSGGRKPGQEDNASFYRKGIAGDWKLHLSEQDAALFQSIAGGLMQELGYI